MEETKTRIRAAAYCRVSTALEIQEGSFEWQKRYYKELFLNNSDVELVHIYGDEGLSGRYADSRPGFQQMLADCEAGKIEAIYTKSISRFSRSLTDCVTAIRRLRNLGIPIYFEKEGLNSMDAQCELMLHIMAIVAQEESNSISQNMKWGIAKRHAEGIPTGRTAYGYRQVDKYGHWQIEESEARRVRAAFEWAVEGAKYQEIRERLDEMEREEQTGFCWTQNRNRVPMLLRNVVYIGDYITDRYFSTVSRNGCRYSRVNRGERDQYYLEAHHEGIVSRELYEKVQMRIRLGLLHSKGKKREKVA